MSMKCPISLDQQCYASNPLSIQHQRGVATILVILMISLAMTAAAFGVVHSLRGNQNMQVAAHASTHSQASAWAGVEVFRKYLSQLAQTPDSLSSLSGSLNMSIASLSFSDLSAHVLSATPNVSGGVNAYDIKANIYSKDTSAGSTSVVQVMYRVTPLSCDNDVELNATLDFYRDLSLGGDITVLTEGGEKADFFVDGNISLMNISTSGISTLHSTGDVELGSAVVLPEVYANGDLVLNGAAVVDSAYVIGDLIVESGSNGRITNEAYVNGDISHGGGPSGDFYSLSSIRIDSGGINVGALNAAASVDLFNGNSVGDVSAKGDVRIRGWFNGVGDVLSEADVSCSNNSWKNYASIKAEGSISGCFMGDATESVDVDVELMTRLQPFSMKPVRVDAWALKTEAHYIFEWDNSIKVSVKNVNGIEDGVYYIGENLEDNRKDYLCANVNNVSKCTSAPVAKICNGQSDYNACFSYDDSTTTWTINGKNMAPGVVWVEGNLALGNGVYYNTFLATGNISTKGSHKTQALNFAGYDVVCKNQFPNTSNNFDDLYPLDFCDPSTDTFKDNSLGNIAFLAGGFIPNSDSDLGTPDADDSDSIESVYEGGDITLGASTEVSGTVMAGNYLFTGGSTTVRGYVSASGQGKGSERSNSLGNSTVIDLTDLPATYNPSRIPQMGEVGSCSGGGNDVSQTLWSKYL